MPLTKEQAESVKKQLIEEFKKIPNADHEQIEKYIESLNEQELEEFLEKNKVQLSGIKQSASQQDKPVFQLIIENQIPSYKIDENKNAIAILEINPFSKGHSLIIPKQKTSIEKIPRSAFSLAQKVSRKIKKKLKPLDIKMETFSLQDYPAINVIPIYKDIQLKKEKATEEDLIKLHKVLQVSKRASRKIPVKKETSDSLTEVKPRVPKFI